MCEQCLLAVVHPEWVEDLVTLIRVDALMFEEDMLETEQSICFFRITRSPAYIPLRVRSIVMEGMLTRRNN